ncbi:synaptogenesis protein syg-2-like [Uloborus diversus]|uniref:synaptogenesis protein syg-2-like n=1 Tax=Uloborus diversus TaxID=327109 RepID=UPI0024099C66|nr:synaptogenesis protein syg-2-like [Uloborus diversus]
MWDHLPCSPDLSPPRFHVSSPMKLELSKRRYHLDDDVKAATQHWLSDFERDFFAARIEKLVLHLNKCLNNGGCHGLRFVYLGVPGSLSKGDPTWLDCGYDLEGDKLYSVKWYKDKVEFYRYLPSENQSKQMFSLDGVFLDLERCNATHAFLYTSDFDTEGTYGCEVSIEVPSYRTIMSEKELRIHAIPDGNPNVFGFLKSYDVGDVVNLTCIFGPSKPAAKLTWFLNAEEAPSSYVHLKLPFPISSDKLKMSESRLIFPLEPHHLWQGFLAVECSAFLSQVHETSSLELIFGEGTSGGMFQRILHAPPGREAPVITGARSRYYVGDVVSLNCSSFRSKELPHLEWHVNEEEVSF